MLGEVLLNKDLPIYEYQNTKLTINDQTWIGGIAGLRNLEQRRNKDMCQGHSSLDAPSELNPPQRIPSPLFHCTTSATGRGLTIVLACYSGRLFDVHVGRVDT